MNDLDRVAQDVHDRRDLAIFLGQMADDFRDNYDSWENTTIYAFLDGLSAWLASADNLYRNLHRELPEQPSWAFVAEMFLAARVYE